jgi:hypothetical protein
MDQILLIGAVAFAIISVIVGYFLTSRLFTPKMEVEKMLMEMAGELKLSYYGPIDGKPPFATGTYSGRGVTFDLLNEKGYSDRWHPHSRIVVSVDRNIKESYIVAYKGRFYSRKTGQVTVNHLAFAEKYDLFSASEGKAERLVTPEVADWVVRLDMPFTLSDGRILFHQDQHFDDKVRTKHILDALIYLANMAERIR